MEKKMNHSNESHGQKKSTVQPLTIEDTGLLAYLIAVASKKNNSTITFQAQNGTRQFCLVFRGQDFGRSMVKLITAGYEFGLIENALQFYPIYLRKGSTILTPGKVSPAGSVELDPEIDQHLRNALRLALLTITNNTEPNG
jgi:hypothetical protein